jgi:hypothetical protein
VDGVDAEGFNEGFNRDGCGEAEWADGEELEDIGVLRFGDVRENGFGA